MEFEVRNATREDLLTIVDFQLKMAWETEKLRLDKAVVTKGVSAVFDDPSKGRYFVVEAAKMVVGSLMLTYEWSDWRNGQTYWIQSVFVDEEVRGLGVFRLLYEHVQQIVNDTPDATGLRLYVDITNQMAQQVYRRVGMNGDHYALFEWMKDF